MIEKLKLRGCNAYIIEDDGRTFLVDTGIPGNLKRIVSYTADLDGILITHAHYDHAGSAYEISEHYSCPVYAHVNDHPYLRREKEFVFRSFIGKFIKNFEKLRKMKPIDPEDITGLNLNSFQVIHLPGHTPGSLALLSDDALICGDVLRVARKGIFFGEWQIRASSRSFNWSNDEYVRSLRRLAEIDRVTVFPGHGIERNVSGDEIRRIAERMEYALG